MWRPLRRLLRSRIEMATGDMPPAAGRLENLFAHGIARHGEGDLAAAEDTYRKVLADDPHHADALHALGMLLAQQGDYVGAEPFFHKAADANPAFLDRLGDILMELRRFPDAADAYRRSLEKVPTPEALYGLGNALQEMRRYADAVASYHRAIALRPAYVEAHYNLGHALQMQGKLNEAAAEYREALSLAPDHALSHNNFAMVLHQQGRLDEAIAGYHKALSLKPDFAVAHNNLGSLYKEKGDLRSALDHFRRALSLKPDYAEAHSNLIFTLDLSAEEDIASLMAERRKWDEAHAIVFKPESCAHRNCSDPERRLKVGYVSADFRVHSAARVFGPMLIGFDRSRYDVIAYSNSWHEDDYTKKFKASVGIWRCIAGHSDDEVAEMIRRDGIDILVDLSGHSAGNRLLVFARKPAPVQVTAWGYATSTGMQAMDFFFADPVIVPPDERSFYREEVRYLPCVAGYFHPEEPPPVKPLPALSNGLVTFGSFNRLEKISAEALKTWTRVLSAVPRSRMVIKAIGLDDVSVRRRIAELFGRAGIEAERITLLGGSSWREHAAAFNQVDIALDPFPHGGGVSTLESLLMGVPVVTLRWPSIVGRLSASVLTALELADWIAETPDLYVEIAVRKARDIESLSSLRNRLRTDFYSSSVGDSKAYVNAVEEEYRSLWREWCSTVGGIACHV